MRKIKEGKKEQNKTLEDGRDADVLIKSEGGL